MNIQSPTSFLTTAKLPEPSTTPWRRREGDPMTQELLERIASQNQRIQALERILSTGEKLEDRAKVVTLKPRLPSQPSPVAIAPRAPARSWNWWPEKPMPARSIEPTPGGACYHLRHAGAKVLAFAVFGLSGSDLEREVSRVADQQSSQGNFTPVFLTDATDTEVFRRRGFVFEYFPDALAMSGSQDLEALQPRLDFIESKWGVDLFINLGLPSGSRIRREVRPPRERYLEAKARFLGGKFASAQRVLGDFTADTVAQTKVRHIRARPTNPAATIIIISHRDHPGVEVGLRSVARQVDPREHEVILVDNGNSSLARVGKRVFRSCTVADPGFNVGCSGARNIGAELARSPLLIFLDDDGVIEEGCIKALVTSLETTGAVAVRGRVKPLTSPDLTGSHYDLGVSRVPALITCEGVSAWRRAPFLEAGGFDPLLAGHEGVALCCRLWRFYGPAGFVYEPDAVLLHDYAPDAKASATKNRRYKASTDYLDFLGLRWQEINAGQLRFVTDPMLGYLSMQVPPRAKRSSPLSVSFLTTCKDSRHFLQEYSASLKNQTETDFEVIFVDDHSQDDSAEELERLWRGDPRMKIHGNRGRGRGAALNEALHHAAGDICLIADVDDLSIVNRVALTRSFFSECPGEDCLSFVAFNETNPFRLGPPKSMFVNDLAVRQLFGMPVSFPTFAFRRERLRLPFDEDLLGGIDCDWFYRNYEHGGLSGKVVFHPAVYYREHAGQITSTRKDHQIVVRRRCIASTYQRVLGELGDFDAQCILKLTETKQATVPERASLTAWVAAFLSKNRSRGVFDPALLDQAMFEVLREFRVVPAK